jgi:hypothetical protein
MFPQESLRALEFCRTANKAVSDAQALLQHWRERFPVRNGTGSKCLRGERHGPADEPTSPRTAPHVQHATTTSHASS